MSQQPPRCGHATEPYPRHRRTIPHSIRNPPRNSTWLNRDHIKQQPARLSAQRHFRNASTQYCGASHDRRCSTAKSHRSTTQRRMSSSRARPGRTRPRLLRGRSDRVFGARAGSWAGSRSGPVPRRQTVLPAGKPDARRRIRIVAWGGMPFAPPLRLLKDHDLPRPEGVKQRRGSRSLVCSSSLRNTPKPARSQDQRAGFGSRRLRPAGSLPRGRSQAGSAGRVWPVPGRVSCPRVLRCGFDGHPLDHTDTPSGSDGGSGSAMPGWARATSPAFRAHTESDEWVGGMPAASRRQDSCGRQESERSIVGSY